MKKDLFIYNELNDVVTKMIAPINIISVSELNGISTIITDTIRVFDNLCDTYDLKEGMLITIDNVNYSVLSVIHTVLEDKFTVSGTGIQATEWNIALNFKPGTSKEVDRILNNEKGELDRFPLMWLLPPFDQDGDHDVLDFSVKINIVFANIGSKTDTTPTRINNNLSPVLQPLITLFKMWLQSSDFNYMLEFFGYGNPVKTKTSNYPFFGNNDKSKTVLTAMTDAINVNYELSFKRQYEY